MLSHWTDFFMDTQECLCLQSLVKNTGQAQNSRREFDSGEGWQSCQELLEVKFLGKICAGTYAKRVITFLYYFCEIMV